MVVNSPLVPWTSAPLRGWSVIWTNLSPWSTSRQNEVCLREDGTGSWCTGTIKVNSVGVRKPTIASVPLPSPTTSWWSPVDCTWSPSTVPAVRNGGLLLSRGVRTNSFGGKGTSWPSLRFTTSNTTTSLNQPCGGFHPMVNCSGLNAWTSDRGPLSRQRANFSPALVVLDAATSMFHRSLRSTTPNPQHHRRPPAVPRVARRPCLDKPTAPW